MQIAKAYLVLLVKLIKLLMGHISPFNQEMIFEVEDEIKQLLLFEVKVVKVHEMKTFVTQPRSHPHSHGPLDSFLGTRLPRVHCIEPSDPPVRPKLLV